MAQDNRSFESTLHDVVYSIDAGTGLKIIRVTLYILILLVIVMVYTATQFRGLKTEEAMDYAQLGRNMSLNNGMVTKCVRPLTMWKMGEQNAKKDLENHPDLYHPPAYPAVLSMGFRFFTVIGLDPFELSTSSRATMPAEQWVILPINHLFTILTGWIVFSLGKRLFSREIGFWGMTIFYLSDVAWSTSISGLNLSMANFFIAAAFHTMVISMLNRRDGSTVKSWAIPFVLSTVCAAIAILTRYIAFAAVPGIALFAWLMAGRFRGGTRFALLFIVLVMVMVSPWIYRNVKVSGNPLAMAAHTALADTTTYPGKQLDRQLEPEFSFKKTSALLKAKWNTTYAKEHTSILPGLGGGVLMALFITTFFYQFVRPQVNYLRWGLGIGMLLTLLIAGFFSDSSVMMIHAFWPFVILYGLAFFYILIDRLDLGARLYTTGLKLLIIVLSLIPLGLTLMPPHGNNPGPPYYPSIISQLTDKLSEREVICTDMPWATAWYGDRTSLLLPRNVDDFYIINDNYGYISALYVTGITKNKPFVKELLAGPEQSWLPIITSGRTPPDFPLKEYIMPSPEWIFFSDRDRWSGSKGAE